MSTRIEADQEIDASESTPAREAAEGKIPARPAAEAEASRSARGGKAKPEKGKKPAQAEGKPDALAGLTAEQRTTVVEAEERMQAIGRRTTGAAFELGDTLLVIKGCYADEADWKAWVKERGGMDMRTADNYLGLPTKLGSFRKRLVASAVPSTVCYAISNADPAVIEEVVGRYENGPRPTLADVRAIANGSASAEPEAAIDPADVGGLAGMRALGTSKVKVGTKVFGDRIAGILAEIEPALEPHWRGKRVGKSGLAKAIQYEARRARSELQNVAVFVEPYDTGPHWNVHPVPFPDGSGWRKVSEVLYALGGVESWPAADKVGSWFVDEVIPTLEWSIGRKPKADQADADEPVAAKPNRKRASGKRNPDEKPEAPGTTEA
ncbi:MAG: hypothetical protein CL534_01215 [Ahrensia sp.]|nr:hypothetical protein [Ahrensia sp.]